MPDFYIHPCPFCGSEDFDTQQGIEDSEGFPTNIVCCECGAAGPWVYMTEKNPPVEMVAMSTGFNTRYNQF